MRVDKFKLGDKVKILPRATTVSVEREEVGKTGVITSISSLENNFNGIIVYMDKICKVRDFRCKWSVGYGMVELCVKKNEQLLFDFMRS